MNFNNGNVPPHMQQQVHLQMLQQQRNLQHLTPQQLQMLQQQQAQQAPQQGVPQGMGLQQQQLLASQRLAAMKQQQAQLQQQQAQQVQQAQQAQMFNAAKSKMAAQQQGMTMGPNGPISVQQAQATTAATAAAAWTKPWESMHYWSEKLKNEGSTPDVDVLLFEQIIGRDLVNKEVLQHERFETGNKPLLSRLMRDLKFYNDLKLARMKTIQYSNTKQYTRSIWGEGYQGYGNGFTDGPTMVLLPKDRKKPSRHRDVYIPQRSMDLQAGSQDELVPIRLEFDSEKDKFGLRDTFLWNLNEKTVSVEQAVATLMEDYRFTNPMFTEAALISVREQLGEYNRHVSHAKYGDDQRITIKLDIAIGNNHLVDQFEWDISNPENNPEEFATIMVEELSLSPDFATAISHAIREQAQIFTKSLYLVGYNFKGGFIEEDDIRNRMSPVVTHADYLRNRTVLSQYTPQVSDISNAELERLDKDRERESRRKRRQGRAGRRGGPTLPDLSDLPKTLRTPAPSTVLPGGLDLGPDVSSYIDVVDTVNRPVDLTRNREIDDVGGMREKKLRRVMVNHKPGYQFLVTIRL